MNEMKDNVMSEDSLVEVIGGVKGFYYPGGMTSKGLKPDKRSGNYMITFGFLRSMNDEEIDEALIMVREELQKRGVELSSKSNGCFSVVKDEHTNGISFRLVVKNTIANDTLNLINQKLKSY